ncbi:MAG: Xaa-Pro peptidase family protein [Pseudoflavonifractor sp.]|nr:Xaa-Pro peptidase family protein [Alloprevotella sp.]MCM1117545.1 Xaa-Pro peptidase family protein [Pseudoflavonifractor sp.]
MPERHQSPLILLPAEEHTLRLEALRRAMDTANMPAILVTDTANIYYLTGRVFSGFIFILAQGLPIFFVRRPVGLEGDGVVYIRKPEQMAESLGIVEFDTIGMELDLLPVTVARRLHAALGQELTIANASPLLRLARSVKTPFEQEKLRQSGIKQERVYRLISKLYREGMTDIELQVEIERALRLEGCLGQFRISGDSMELYMANILTGDNADNPTPYDFAMGGAGLDPSLPVGADGEIIKEGHSVMVDANGNFTGYMTDMTRTFSVGPLEPLAIKAQQTSIEICRAIANEARPGAKASDLYHLAEKMAAEASLAEYFMGHHQKAGFVGHGVGIEINELPVLAPRSHDVIAQGQVIAVEPKFVIPGVGAMGIENTYIIGADSTECITNAPENLISLI